MSIADLRRDIVIGILLLATMWALRPRDRVRVVHTTSHTTSTEIVPMPTLIPIEREIRIAGDAARCPPPRHDVPRTRLRQPPEGVDFVQPSVTNSGWVAAWNSEHVYISTNAGSTWTRVHDGEGAVRDVDFDCFGRPLVVRGSIAGLDPAGDFVVLGGGPDMVVIGRAPHGEDDPHLARIAISRDGGATWRTRDLVESWETPVYGRQYEDGTIATIVHQGDCGGQAPYAFAFDRDLAKVESNKLAVYEELLGRDGGIDGIDAYRNDTSILDGGPYPIIVANERAYRYTRGKATELPVKVSSEISFAAVADAAGRIWGTACGEIVIAGRELTAGAYCN